MVAPPETKPSASRKRSWIFLIPLVVVLGLGWLLHSRQTLDASLLRAVNRQDPAAVSRLLLLGASPNSTDKESHTALFLTLNPGEVLNNVHTYNNVYVDAELDNNSGEMPELKWPNDRYPHLSGQGNRIAALLLNAGADPNQASNGDSYLFLALFFHSLPSVKALLAHGADPNAAYGMHPLLNIAVQYDAELYSLGKENSPLYTQSLLSAGANAHLKRSYTAASGTAFQEETPLITAVFYGDNIRNFLNQGSDPPLVQTLLDHGADINGQDQFGRTALLIAAAQGNPEIVRMLLAHGANSHMTNQQGHTALQETQMVETNRLAGAERYNKNNHLSKQLAARERQELKMSAAIRQMLSKGNRDNNNWNDEAKIRQRYGAVKALLIKTQSSVIY